uniref:uncharacterized protein LOC129499895 isoform X1 n=1 Tax=Nyctereutes procyonoides TaxID=34880 RepID=UPI002444E367|nr:uncharacterized protein LOC129499895 isoform X1 [Nyctereutes procyonoides]
MVPGEASSRGAHCRGAKRRAAVHSANIGEPVAQNCRSAGTGEGGAGHALRGFPGSVAQSRKGCGSDERDAGFRHTFLCLVAQRRESGGRTREALSSGAGTREESRSFILMTILHACSGGSSREQQSNPVCSFSNTCRNRYTVSAPAITPQSLSKPRNSITGQVAAFPRKTAFIPSAQGNCIQYLGVLSCGPVIRIVPFSWELARSVDILKHHLVY